MREHLLEGQVVPACPLALNENGIWSEQYQRVLVRYYIDARAGGLAVGVHSTQFEIRDPQHGLFEPVLRLVSEEIDAYSGREGERFARIAGLCGKTAQALQEAQTALSLNYEVGLLSLGAWRSEPESAVLEHCRRVAQEIAVIGFYLQPSVGGRLFSFDFWRQFIEIPNVVAVKIAPFNRYQTLDVVRAVVESGREDIALYTGNDDNIILDLLTIYEFPVGGKQGCRLFNGGLLGQWGVWTQRAVQLLEELKRVRGQKEIPAKWLKMNIALTDANAAIFDAANQFSGCIPGILEVLRRQGLVPSRRCLDQELTLSPGQEKELHRVQRAYPTFNDDAFVKENIDRWLA